MSVALSHQVRAPHWILNYAGADISADISPMVISIAYFDYLSARAGELEVALEDSDRRWQGAWYPGLGDRLNLSIGYASEPLLPCGDFEIDQLELEGPADVFRLRCLSAYITPAMRTRYCVAYENQSLLQIATAVAAKYQLGVVAAPDAPDLRFERVTQSHETDLAFLNRLALAHGYDFTVRGTDLVFYSRAALEAQPPTLTLKRGDVVAFAFENRTRAVYKAAEVAYHDGLSRSLIAYTAAAENIPTGDTRKLIVRCENAQQAMLKARAALTGANQWFLQARLTMPGTTAVSAGNILALDGWASFDGAYIVETARHSLSRRSGYVTQIHARRVA